MSASPPPLLQSVAVFCGSSPGYDKTHAQLARALGLAIAERGLRLVYGGGGLGLMGETARAAYEMGADILGVIPEFLAKAEGAFPNIQSERGPDMHQRKLRMYEASDAFIVLPGGIGTLEEAIEVLSWQRLNLHEKPVVFLSNTAYWDRLLELMHHMIDAGFAPESMVQDLLSATSISNAFDLIQDRLANPIERPPLQLRDVSISTGM